MVADARGAEAADGIAALERRVRFLDEVLEASANAVVVVDAEMNVRWTGRSVTTFTGWTTAQLTGTCVMDLLHPGDLERAAAELDDLLSGRDNQRGPFLCRIRVASGDFRWVSVAGRDLRDVAGVDGLVFALTDVHEVTLARRRLEATERRFEALVRHAQDIISLVDADGFITWVSPSAETLLGWPIDDVVGVRVGTGLAEEHADALRRAHREVVADPGARRTLTVTVPHSGGQTLWLEATLANHLDDADVGAVVVNLHDVTDSVRMVQQLEVQAEVLRSFAFSSTTGLFELESEHGLVYANERFEQITGLVLGEARGDGWLSLLVDPGALDEVLGGGAEIHDVSVARVRLRRPDGELRWVDVRVTLLPPDEQGVSRRLGGIEDVTVVVEAEEARNRLVEVSDMTDDLVMLVDTEGRVLYANHAARTFFGDVDGVDVLGGELGQQEIAREIEEQLVRQGGERWKGEMSVRNRLGQSVPMSLRVMAHRSGDGVLQYLSVVGRDISERIALETTLERQATHDPLTGLPNRALLLDRIERSTSVTHRVGGEPSIALLFVDLDHFKVINDSLGHALGDELLKAIAERILTVIRPGDTVARFGGDEFVVLCDRMAARDDALAIAHRLETTLLMPFRIAGHEIHVGVSIGIAFADEDEVEATALLRDADTAMYEAKSSGRGRWVVFDDELRRRAVDRQRVESALRHTRNGEDLEMHYQPVVDLGTGRMRGVEALLRWRHEGRLVPPADFVGIAEETGLIVPIGSWVLETACAQAAAWQRLPGWHELEIAVNVSARQLQRHGFTAVVTSVLSSSGLAPGSLTLEITESVLLDDLHSTVVTLEELRELGVRIAVDDFGTGYSSLTYLHRLPIDVVKLDRSFVDGVDHDEQTSAIVESVVGLARAMGLAVVAEGIETEAQMEALHRLGCDLGQGHLVSPAVDVGEITELLTDPTRSSRALRRTAPPGAPAPPAGPPGP